MIEPTTGYKYLGVDITGNLPRSQKNVNSNIKRVKENMKAIPLMLSIRNKDRLHVVNAIYKSKMVYVLLPLLNKHNVRKSIQLVDNAILSTLGVKNIGKDNMERVQAYTSVRIDLVLALQKWYRKIKYRQIF